MPPLKVHKTYYDKIVPALGHCSYESKLSQSSSYKGYAKLEKLFW